MGIDTVNQEELRQRFNPEGSQLRRHQLRMLDMLLELDKICQKHDVPYWLSSGTLIGAMRHNGFIPWDDDLDVEMMRSDYLRLMDILPHELPDWMALQDNSTDPSYFNHYAKLRDRRSFLEESINYDRCLKERGIYIDIFPLEKQVRWVHILSEKTTGHMYKVWRTSKNDEKSLPKVLFIFKFNQRWVYPILRCLCRMAGSKVITSGLGIPYHNPRYEKDIFPLTTHEFEGHQLPVPHDSDHLLRGIYGDYMQLPDPESLKPHIKSLEIYE